MKGQRTVLYGLLAFLMLCALPVAVARADGLSKDDLSSSSWNTYYTVGGQKVRAIVTFDGKSGTYDVLNADGDVIATGNLSKVLYAMVDAKKGTFFIQGEWSLNGESGGFTFKSVRDDPFRFAGEWVSGGGKRSGKWNGKYRP